MLCDLLSRELRFVCRRVFGFLLHSFSSAMGCIFVCLQVRDNDSDRSYRLDKKSDVTVSRNRLSSLLAVEGKIVQQTKAIGFLDLRGLAWRLKMRKLWTDKQPSKLSEGFEIDAESPDLAPISCISDGNNSESTCISSTEVAASGNLISAAKVIDDKNISITTPFTPWPAERNTQGGSKSVHFHRDINICSTDDSLPGNACSGFKIKDSKSKDSAMKIWPPPTPVKLSDEMKTSGTVFSANMENVQKGKAGIRSQYVYSIPNQTTDGSQLKAPMEEISQHNQLSDHQEVKFEATLSNWLKPPIDNRKSFQPTYNKQAQFGRTCGDRPILGLVVTHWNEEEQSQHITPKWWGGNGIPNSTSKYQEDQKVSWHATPFEERLEKAVSEESSFGNRGHVRGSPLSLEEDGDSATSQLQSKKTLDPF